ncbi:Hypothetical protein Eab7_2493 [Exiguobacterium antarcticum B7]|nr:Hypothetical protein Eab7_2493 [Exiguobacterium antarcticum B7]
MRLLQEKARVFALSETNETRFPAHTGQENWLVSRLRKVHEEEDGTPVMIE